MSCIALLDLREAEELHSFMPSLVVMWSQPSMVKPAWQTWDMSADASDVFARPSQYPQRCMIMTWMSLRNLW